MVSESFGFTGPYICLLELHGTFGKIISLVCAFWMDLKPTLQLTFIKFPLFFQMREEIGGQLMKLEDIMEYSRYFQNPSQANSETKKV